MHNKFSPYNVFHIKMSPFFVWLSFVLNRNRKFTEVLSLWHRQLDLHINSFYMSPQDDCVVVSRP